MGRHTNMRYGFLLIVSIALLQNSFALPLQQGEEWIDEAECLEPNSEPFIEPRFETGSIDSSKQETADFNLDCDIENEFSEAGNEWMEAAAARSDQWTEQQFDLGD